ncbi:MAG: ribbon-helix-helix protein, CopG family [Chloroflexi bacterium]|nr:ribbon-helix-helix protein, CopG family [Chloroflexota bacterium]
MSKKVIQVPVDEELLKGLESLSRKRHKSRSELIRQACLRYIREIEQEEMDRRYREGYRKAPEAPGIGEAQAAIAGEILPEEKW